MTQTPDAAHVVVLRGDPDEHELAALVASLAAVAAAVADEQHAGSGAWQDAAPTPWTDRRRTLARPLAAPLPARRGPDAWRWSLHP